MLIPRFSLSQTATHLSITIRCPYVKFSSSTDDSHNVEVDLPTANEFYFACKPYYLHLYLPGNVIDKEQPDYKYDLETSSFCFNYEKQNPNEIFEDLDMISKLLNKDNRIHTDKIEEIGDRSDNADDEDEDEDEDEPLWNQMRQLELNG